MNQPLHWPPPPYDWHTLRVNDEVEEWRVQWQHYEPLLASCGYTVSWVELGDVPRPEECPRGFYLPPAADPFFPRTNECFVAFPFTRPTSSYTGHSLVRVAHDPYDRLVAIKAMLTSSDEYAVVKYLQALRLEAPDPADHTIPILDRIELVDGTAFVVMPKWSDGAVPFWTLLDVFNHFEECLKGLIFMHEHRVAHLDIYLENIVMNYEGLARFKFAPGPFRSLFDARYAYIDFGSSKLFPKELELSSCTTTGNIAAFQAPEQSETIPYNPFSVDVYQLGKTFFEYFKEDMPFTNIHDLVALHIPELLTLIEDMTSQDPLLRPTAESALQTLRAIRSNCPVHVLDIHVESKEGGPKPAQKHHWDQDAMRAALLASMGESAGTVHTSPSPNSELPSES